MYWIPLYLINVVKHKFGLSSTVETILESDIDTIPNTNKWLFSHEFILKGESTYVGQTWYIYEQTVDLNEWEWSCSRLKCHKKECIYFKPQSSFVFHVRNDHVTDGKKN